MCIDLRQRFVWQPFCATVEGSDSNRDSGLKVLSDPTPSRRSEPELKRLTRYGPG